MIATPRPRAVLPVVCVLACLCASSVHAESKPLRPRLNAVHASYPSPAFAFDAEPPAPAADDTLARAIAEAYRNNPSLAARRYEQRATDDSLTVALSQSRATATMQIAAGYDYTDPSRITQAARPLVDRINTPNIERNDLNAQLVIDQPVWTGGRTTADVRAARADIAAGRETLRGAEADLLLDVIAAYADIRRDGRSVGIRERNLNALEATLDEVVARREAGELTRTDIAQAETQILSARVQLDAARSQLESSRAAFAGLVGRGPGELAPEPALPRLPVSVDEAFAMAEQFNPEIAGALATERASRARIASAKSEGRPTLSLQGIARAAGPFVPFHVEDQDVILSGRATLIIPLTAGGRVAGQVSRAENLNSADFLRVEAARRQIIEGIVNAWNGWVTADRNLRAQEVQLQAARIYYEGTFEEYREGLRSTFDVLFALNSMRETEIAILGSTRDRYVAQAALLRQTGLLEAARLMSGSGYYDAVAYTHTAERRSALPWDPLFQAADRLVAPATTPRPIARFPANASSPQMAPGSALPDDVDLVRGGSRIAPRGDAPIAATGDE